ncbi:MAG: biotin--[acetyl-CoA-carboxylase] ligase [Gemmatimonadetes bacterium]|nr:biotin--[acetyl-CoA-carboxylase] ligase [Gemmatimonadota bacterium]
MTYDGFTEAQLAARLRVSRCLVLGRVTSTLDLVHELAAEGAPAGTVVLADEQVAGRGQRGRRWHSPPGTGIWLGYLVRSWGAAGGGVLSLRVGLSVVAALADLGVETLLKWPNDVMLGGRKVAGILCEARTGMEGTARETVPTAWVAVGIGLNVRGSVPAEVAETAAVIADVKPAVTRVDVLECLVSRLHALAQDSVLTAAERAAYDRCDWLAGRRIREPVKGRAEGIDEDGALLVATARGRRRVMAGSVVAA